MPLPSPRAVRTGCVALLLAAAVHPGQLHDAAPPAHASGPLLYEQAAGGDPDAAPSSERQVAAVSEPGTPPIVEAYFERNAVAIRALRCSGAVVWNTSGQPVGALTADHCLDGSPINPQYKGSDRRRYLVNKDGVTAVMGPDADNAQLVAPIEQFVVPPKPKNNQWDTDQALAIFPGHEPEEVIRSWQRQQMSPSKIERLGYKTKVWLSGYPYPTSRSTIKGMPRQTITTEFVATEPVRIADSGKGTSMEVSTTHQASSTNTICSWGTSGGPAVVIETIKKPDGAKKKTVWPIGDFSGFLSFHTLKEEGGSRQTWPRSRAIESYKAYHSNYPWVSLKNVDSTCDYSYQPISPSNYRLINVVTGVDQIPAPAKKIN